MDGIGHRHGVCEEKDVANVTDHEMDESANRTISLMIGAYSDRGGRGVNEDCYLSDEGFACVSDGIGGAARGDDMSRYCCGRLRDAWREDPCTNEEELRQAFITTDRFVSLVSKYNSELGYSGYGDGSGGATLVAMCASRGSLLFGCVGDSAAFLFDDGAEKVERVLEGSGRSTKQGSRANALDAAMGYRLVVDDTKLIRTTTLTPTSNVRVLLCTDGVWSQLGEQRMLSALKEEPNPQTCAVRLVSEAVDACSETPGSSDNATAVVADVIVRDVADKTGSAGIGHLEETTPSAPGVKILEPPPQADGVEADEVADGEPHEDCVSPAPIGKLPDKDGDKASGKNGTSILGRLFGWGGTERGL